MMFWSRGKGTWVPSFISKISCSYGHS